MKKIFVIVVAASTLLSGMARLHAEPLETEVRAVIEAQREAWNNGDIETYLAPILNSDRTRHIINGTVIEGYDEIREGYLARNGGKASGKIDFRDLAVTPLGDDAALAFAHWSFELGEVKRKGIFTLIFEKIDGQWVITHDHTALGH